MIRKSSWLVSAGLFVLATPAFGQTATSNTDTDKQTAQPTQGATAEAAAVQDQARVMTPRDALAAGADYLVVGRPITAAADPVAALDAINASIGFEVRA